MSTVSEVNLINGETPLTIWTLNTDIHKTKFKLSDGNVYNFTDIQLNGKVQPLAADSSGIVSPYKEKFTNKYLITDVSCCEHIKQISDFAFYYCTNLSSINCPNVSSIGNYSFYYCSNLRELNLSNITNVISYGINAFNNCSNVSVYLSNDTMVNLYANDTNWKTLKTNKGFVFVPVNI